MAICNHGHYYDESRNPAGCPECGRIAQGGGGGAAPRTIHEGGGGAAPAGPVAQPPWQQQGGGVPPTVVGGGGGGGGRAAPVSPPWQRAPGPPAGGGHAAPRAGGPRTMLEDDVGVERLMGFVVVVNSREDDINRYIRLRKGINYVGRFGARAHVELRDGDCSAEHALVLCTNASTRVIDLDSTNGLFVNGSRTDLAELQAGDVVRVGNTHLAFVPFRFVAED